jgi:hypothetical protein
LWPVFGLYSASPTRRALDDKHGRQLPVSFRGDHLELVVLIAYASPPSSLRRALGVSAAAAFCGLPIFARWLDMVEIDDRRLLSHWPVAPTTRDRDSPDPNAG